MSVQYCEVPLPQIFALRHAVLRPGLPTESAQFDGDVSARHFAAQREQQIIGCLTMMERAYYDESPGWQLRGMATVEAFRGQGIGKNLLAFMETKIIPEQNPALLWCHAREHAVDFYKRCGWIVDSDIFETPGVGMHFRMVKNND
ncbi:MAG: GNAT family N-acetyltransferase [Planctomycetes bacterium]|nr:GNAT family N-acetyltransferase [Planctomycetota bacterium]